MTIFNRLARPDDFNPAGCCIAGVHHPLVTPLTLRGQHPARDWEYSLALRALEEWGNTRFGGDDTLTRGLPLFSDIGGAGSNFWQTLTHYTAKPITRIDPNHEWQDWGTDPNLPALLFRETLAQYRAARATEGCPEFDAVFCLSVIEHVPIADYDGFVEHLLQLVKPGGLLVLTCDAAEALPDVYHFHWMRARIFDPATLQALGSAIVNSGFRPLDNPDFTWHGPTVYDYTFGALALVKEG